MKGQAIQGKDNDRAKTTLVIARDNARAWHDIHATSLLQDWRRVYGERGAWGYTKEWTVQALKERNRDGPTHGN